MSSIDNFETGSISKVVLKNAIPAIIKVNGRLYAFCLYKRIMMRIVD